MTIATEFPNKRPTCHALGAISAITLAVTVSAGTTARADIIKKEDMLRGVVVTRAQCAATAQAVWVSVFKQEFCVRYYLSTAGGEGLRPVVFLQGDYLGKMSPKRICLIPQIPTTSTPTI